MDGVSPESVSVVVTANEACVRLAGLITVPMAAQMRAKALEALQSEASLVTVDCSAVEHIDCSGVQVLLSLSQSLKDSGRTLKLQSVPEPMRATLRMVGA